MQLDQEIKQTVFKIIQQVHQFAKFQKENKELLGRSKSSFQGRIAEIPYELDRGAAHILKYKGLQPEIINHKK